MESPHVREPGRKTPEEILESIERESRGKLTIYLGSSAGVGKTYSMLEAAREKKHGGADVVIGWIDTHGRKETEKLTKGIERVQPMLLEYRGKSFREMDLDSVLKRKPNLVLVDELAHTNIQGSRHSRRFQDVEELLRSGINVYTTVNIQHVESLNDVVAQITGIVVRETVPDRIIEEADSIRLIDISTDELVNRLKEGKVYIPAQAEQALSKFFRPGNLNALRELAMRFAARRVDREISEYMRAHRIEGPWPMAGNVMVCIGGSPFSAQLIRAAFQLSRGLRSEWYALHVDTSKRLFPMGDRERTRIHRNMRLAEELGAKTITVIGEDLASEILETARIHNISSLVVGKPRHNKAWDLIYGSVVDELSRKGGGLNIYIIQTGISSEAPPSIKTGTSVPQFNWMHYAVSLMMSGLVTAAGLFFKSELDLINIAFLYLLPVVLSASWWGRWPSYFTAFCSVLFFDFLFVPPIFTFTVHDIRHALSFVIFMIVAFIIGGKTEQLKSEAQSARIRERNSRTLYEFGREIAGVSDLAVIAKKLSTHMAETLEREVVVLFPGGENELKLSYCYNPRRKNEPFTAECPDSQSCGNKAIDSSTMAVAVWVYKNARVAGRSTDTLSDCSYLFVPLLAKGKAEGVLGVNMGNENLMPEQWRLLDTWVQLAAIMIERVKMDEVLQEAALFAESKRLQSTLFNSLSHELKTPLSSIIGSVSTLVEAGDVYTSDQKSQLLHEIRGGAMRLERVVANLLDTARLESGMLELKIDSGDIVDIVGTSLRQMRDILKSGDVTVDIPPDIPFVRCDSVLIELVLVNLLDNALKFCRTGAKITISASSTDGRVKVSVADEGPGVPPEELGNIFDKFHRVKVSESTAGGSGLGLSICKAVIELHGGEIWAENRMPTGTAVHFTLPADLKEIRDPDSQEGDERNE